MTSDASDLEFVIPAEAGIHEADGVAVVGREDPEFVIPAEAGIHSPAARVALRTE